MRKTGGDTSRLDDWLRVVVQTGGSDLLLVSGTPPAVRVDGRLRPIGDDRLGGDDIEDAVQPALPPHARKAYKATGIADASYRITDVGRFRINLHRERGRAAAAIRSLPMLVPLPNVLSVLPSPRLITSK